MKKLYGGLDIHKEKIAGCILNESGDVKTEYTYRINNTTDPDNVKDEIYYIFDWGDGTFSQWYNRYWFQGGFMKHSWKKQGDYNVRVKAKDIYGKESEWGDSLEISMPKAKSFNDFNPWIFRLIHRFPILQYLL
jgi:hypothetical protein